MPVKRFSKGFKDISLSFKRHPVTNDVLTLKNEDAIKRSVQNLVRIKIGEVFFDGDFGTRITGSLFELATDENIDNNYPAVADSGGVGGFDTSRSIRFSSTAKSFDAAA